MNHHSKPKRGIRNYVLHFGPHKDCCEARSPLGTKNKNISLTHTQKHIHTYLLWRVCCAGQRDWGGRLNNSTGVQLWEGRWGTVMGVVWFIHLLNEGGCTVKREAKYWDKQRGHLEKKERNFTSVQHQCYFCHGLSVLSVSPMTLEVMHKCIRHYPYMKTRL